MKISKELLTEVVTLLESLSDICDTANLTEDQLEILNEEELIPRSESAIREIWSILNG